MLHESQPVTPTLCVSPPQHCRTFLAPQHPYDITRCPRTDMGDMSVHAMPTILPMLSQSVTAWIMGGYVLASLCTQALKEKLLGQSGQCHICSMRFSLHARQEKPDPAISIVAVTSMDLYCAIYSIGKSDVMRTSVK